MYWCSNLPRAPCLQPRVSHAAKVAHHISGLRGCHFLCVTCSGQAFGCDGNARSSTYPVVCTEAESGIDLRFRCMPRCAVPKASLLMLSIGKRSPEC